MPSMFGFLARMSWINCTPVLESSLQENGEPETSLNLSLSFDLKPLMRSLRFCADRPPVSTA